MDRETLEKKFLDVIRITKSKEKRTKELEAESEKLTLELKKLRDESGDLKMEHTIVKEQLSSAYTNLAEIQEENKVIQLINK